MLCLIKKDYVLPVHLYTFFIISLTSETIHLWSLAVSFTNSSNVRWPSHPYFNHICLDYLNVYESKTTAPAQSFIIPTRVIINDIKFKVFDLLPLVMLHLRNGPWFFIVLWWNLLSMWQVMSIIRSKLF